MVCSISQVCMWKLSVEFCISCFILKNFFVLRSESVSYIDLKYSTWLKFDLIKVFESSGVCGNEVCWIVESYGQQTGKKRGTRYTEENAFIKLKLSLLTIHLLCLSFPSRTWKYWQSETAGKDDDFCIPIGLCFLTYDLYTIKDYYVFFSLTEVVGVGVLFLMGFHVGCTDRQSPGIKYFLPCSLEQSWNRFQQ